MHHGDVTSEDLILTVASRPIGEHRGRGTSRGMMGRSLGQRLARSAHMLWGVPADGGCYARRTSWKWAVRHQGSEDGMAWRAGCGAGRMLAVVRVPVPCYTIR